MLSRRTLFLSFPHFSLPSSLPLIASTVFLLTFLSSASVVPTNKETDNFAKSLELNAVTGMRPVLPFTSKQMAVLRYNIALATWGNGVHTPWTTARRAGVALRAPSTRGNDIGARVGEYWFPIILDVIAPGSLIVRPSKSANWFFLPPGSVITALTNTETRIIG